MIVLVLNKISVKIGCWVKVGGWLYRQIIANLQVILLVHTYIFLILPFLQLHLPPWDLAGRPPYWRRFQMWSFRRPAHWFQPVHEVVCTRLVLSLVGLVRFVVNMLASKPKWCGQHPSHVHGPHVCEIVVGARVLFLTTDGRQDNTRQGTWALRFLGEGFVSISTSLHPNDGIICLPHELTACFTKDIGRIGSPCKRK